MNDECIPGIEERLDAEILRQRARRREGHPLEYDNRRLTQDVNIRGWEALANRRRACSALRGRCTTAKPPAAIYMSCIDTYRYTRYNISITQDGFFVWLSTARAGQCRNLFSQSGGRLVDTLFRRGRFYDCCCVPSTVVLAGFLRCCFAKPSPEAGRE